MLIDLGAFMSNNYDIIIGVDPGVKGGISILHISNGKVSPTRIPVIQVEINRKKKKVYDVEEIVKLFKQFTDKKVLFIQEKVSSHPGEGSASAFGFGRSAGLTLGIAHALDFTVIEVSSQKWKKEFPQLNTPEIIIKKAEVKDLRAIRKTLKGKASKKQNKKHIDKLNRQIKADAKTAARELVSSMYPNIADQFEQKDTDGIAESLLIALFGRKNKDELV